MHCWCYAFHDIWWQCDRIFPALSFPSNPRSNQAVPIVLFLFSEVFEISVSFISVSNSIQLWYMECCIVVLTASKSYILKTSTTLLSQTNFPLFPQHHPQTSRWRVFISTTFSWRNRIEFCRLSWVMGTLFVGLFTVDFFNSLFLLLSTTIEMPFTSIVLGWCFKSE